MSMLENAFFCLCSVYCRELGWIVHDGEYFVQWPPTLHWLGVKGFFPPQLKFCPWECFFSILLPCTLLENHSTVCREHTVWMKTAWKSREYFCAQNSAKRKEKRIIILFLYTCSVGPLFYLNWHPKYSKIPNVGMVMGLIALLAIIRLLTIFQVLVHLVQFASSGQTNIHHYLNSRWSVTALYHCRVVRAFTGGLS